MERGGKCSRTPVQRPTTTHRVARRRRLCVKKCQPGRFGENSRQSTVRAAHFSTVTVFGWIVTMPVKMPMRMSMGVNCVVTV